MRAKRPLNPPANFPIEKPENVKEESHPPVATTTKRAWHPHRLTNPAWLANVPSLERFATQPLLHDRRLFGSRYWRLICSGNLTAVPDGLGSSVVGSAVMNHLGVDCPYRFTRPASGGLYCPLRFTCFGVPMAGRFFSFSIRWYSSLWCSRTLLRKSSQNEQSLPHRPCAWPRNASSAACSSSVVNVAGCKSVS